MKFYFYLLFVSMTLLSCRDEKDSNQKKIVFDLQKQKTHQSKISDKNDCPIKFDIFFKNFAKDSIFQKKAIAFPLKLVSYDYDVSEDPIIIYIKGIHDYHYIDFRNDSLSMQKEHDKYAVEKTKTETGLIYKRVGYDNGIYISYEFKRIDGCWFLVSIVDESS